ncbi:PAS domain S-box-containing protein [Geodermatophilus obscurus]|uniref:PAS domain S-box-containing protein n=1 Tax=Geodermatophilus obscurus TaxID=1861 RepID=A0A1M7UY61_9ACTN|nr:SpoIIE family protein phosphatase [Geodermatophilus obscurus]SHN87908.1 PAS domain S-box-containing protein [Geodermatophilus obscurus]
MAGTGTAADGDDAGRALLALPVDAAGIGTFEVDVATGRLTWNRRMSELLGVAPEDVSGEPAEVHRHIDPADVARVAADVEAALAGIGGYTAECRVPLPDGRTRHLSARGQLITDAAGNPLRLVGAALDVTAERKISQRVHAALESLPISYLAMDADWRMTYLNARAERLTGRSRDELLGRTLWEAFPAIVGTVFEERSRQALRSGEAITFEASHPEAPDVWVEVRAVPGSGGLALYSSDVTDRRRAQEVAAETARRRALLAAVTEQLTGTMDAERAVAHLAQLVVPALADWCVVTLVDDEGPAGGRRNLRDVGWWHADEAMRTTLDAYAERRIPALTEDSFLLRALVTGRSVTVDSGATAAVRSVLAPGQTHDLIAQLAPEAMVVLPLRGRGRTVGLLTLFNGSTRASMNAAGRDTATEVAARAGLALDNSRLYRQQRDLAAGLQRSLLTRPVQPDHVQIVVRYTPAAEGADVGGDWYDAFMQPDGATVLVIGDVIGHDTEAAAAMGQARTVLRSLAAAGHDGPAEVLHRTDEVLETLRTGILATALAGRLEQDADLLERGLTRLRWSSAGHPPAAVVAPDGSVRLLAGEKADLLLGVVPDTARQEHEVLLEYGATVLLYTDGLIEARDQPIEEGLQRLQETLTDLAADDPPLDELVDQLLERMLPPQPEDDVALVAVRLHDQRGPRPAEAGPNRTPPGFPDT